MDSRHTAARAATVVAASTLLGLLVGGSALAAVGTDGAVGIPAPQAVPVALAPTPTPSPTSDPLAPVTGLVDTAKQALGLAPSPSATPTPTPTGGTVAEPQAGGSDTVTPPVVTVVRHPRVQRPAGTAGAVGLPLGSFGATLGDRRPAVEGVSGPVEGAVSGIGSMPIAVAPLPHSAAGTLGDDSEGSSSLPGLLVVCASACVAAAAAGNAEVWRRRLADSLS
jgi:hypothetical protein